MLYDTYEQFSQLDTTVYILLTIILLLDFIARHGHNPSQTVGHRRHHDGFLRRVSLAKNEEYIVFRVKIHTSRKTQLPRFWHGIFSLVLAHGRYGTPTNPLAENVPEEHLKNPVSKLTVPNVLQVFGTTIKKQAPKQSRAKCLRQ